MVQQSVINTMLNRPTDSPIGSVYAPVPEAATPSLERLDQLALEQSRRCVWQIWAWNGRGGNRLDAKKPAHAADGSGYRVYG